MGQLFVGVGQVDLFIRHARTLKDKRQILKGLKQKLVNRGFSVTECDHLDNPKQASVGFSVVGSESGKVDQWLRDGVDLFFGNFEVTNRQRDVLDYSFERENPDLNYDKYGDEI